jgi:hypothetical protein
MNSATHTVEVPFPQAFASPKRSPFPSAPRYGMLLTDTAIGNPTARWECALLRDSTQPITDLHRNDLIR